MDQFDDAAALATAIAVAWLGNPHTRASADDVALFLSASHRAIGALTQPAAAPTGVAPPALTHAPAAVSVRRSLASPEHILSMIDGKPYRALKRHLSANGLTPDQYRQRFGLKADYPMTAPAYSAARSAISIAAGFGRKLGVTNPTVEHPATPRKMLGIVSTSAGDESQTGS